MCQVEIYFRICEQCAHRKSCRAIIFCFQYSLNRRHFGGSYYAVTERITMGCYHIKATPLRSVIKAYPTKIVCYWIVHHLAWCGSAGSGALQGVDDVPEVKCMTEFMEQDSFQINHIGKFRKRGTGAKRKGSWSIRESGIPDHDVEAGFTRLIGCRIVCADGNTRKTGSEHAIGQWAHSSATIVVFDDVFTIIGVNCLQCCGSCFDEIYSRSVFPCVQCTLESFFCSACIYVYTAVCCRSGIFDWISATAIHVAEGKLFYAVRIVKVCSENAV